MKRALFLLALLLSLSVAASDQPHAGGSWKDVKITDVTILTAAGPAGKGYVIVTFSSNGTGTPSCANGYPKNLVIDISAAGGALAVAAVEQGMMMGSTVTVTGSGVCSLNTLMETMASIQTQPVR